MKRSDLLRQLEQGAKSQRLALVLLRSQGGHDVYVLDGLRLAIPRHRELAEGTADGIRRRAEQKLGRRWWT